MSNIINFLQKYDIYIIVFLTTLLWLTIFENSLHILQLNSYKNGTHLKWLSKNIFKVYFTRNANPKKPLVYTHRVIRMIVTGLLVFLIINGLFVMSGVLLLVPVSVILAPLFPIIANIINSPFEKANNNRYIRQAKNIIDSRPDLITIAVTGSYGKTSVKYYLTKLLSAKYNVLMTPESYNTTLGVVKTIRNELRATHQVFVCEMGMKWKGDIAELCEIAKPKHAIITSIGAQHLESMKTLDNIIHEKFTVADYITDGILFLNYDNEYIADRKTENKTVIRYGINSESSAKYDYKASGITSGENGTTFTVHAPSGESAVFETALLGEHNVQNILSAIAASHSLGVGLNELILPVKRLECVPHRLQIISGGDNSANTIIDDSFNSNPAGAKAALDVLKSFGGVKILLTPGMIELGEKSHELNRTFGEQAAACCDYAFLIGEKQAKPIKEGLLKAGFPEEKIRVFNSFNEGMDFAKELDAKGDKKVILIENDLPDNY